MYAYTIPQEAICMRGSYAAMFIGLGSEMTIHASAGFPHETGVGQGHVLHEAPLIIIYTKCSFDDDTLCKDDCTRSFYTSMGHFYHQHAGKKWPPYALPYVPA